jgi:hypothetical protein
MVSIILCLVVWTGCEVRPFSTLSGEESVTDDDGTELPPDGTETLLLSAVPSTIDTLESTPENVQVSIDNPEPGRIYTFEITTAPLGGEAIIDANEGSLSYAPDAGFTGTDSLEVTATNDQVPPQSGSITIAITVNSLQSGLLGR